MDVITLDKQNIKPNSICFKIKIAQKTFQAKNVLLLLFIYCIYFISNAIKFIYSIKLGICLNTFKPIFKFPLSPCESVWFYLMIKAVGCVGIQVVSRTLMNIPEGVTGGAACPK